MIDLLGNIIFIAGPCLGFIPQIIKKDITFAPILSFILILANIFKILYFKISSSFSYEIFLQSIFLIFFHLLLIYKSKNNLSILEEKIMINKYTEKSYKKYGLFSLIFSLIISTFLSFIFLGYFFNFIYFLTCPFFIILECSVGVFQLLILEHDQRYSLVKTKFPKELFLLWAFGDLLKLFWMLKIKGEALMCASVIFQIILDLAVVIRYGRNRKV